jgi:hypothetical protein
VAGAGETDDLGALAAAGERLVASDSDPVIAYGDRDRAAVAGELLPAQAVGLR